MRSAMAILTILLLGLTGLASAQTVISAKAGMIHYAEGDVRLDGKLVEPKVGNFPNIRQNSELRTAEGRAEVLLSPGVVMWVSENAALRMVSERLSDIKVALTSGSAVVEVMELNGNAVSFAVGEASIALEKSGLYRVDAEPAQLKVFDGEAVVEQGGQAQEVKKSRLLALNGISTPEKFNNKLGDSLLRWARRRSEYMALANVSAARYARDRNLLWSTSGLRGAFILNPWYGIYCWVPGAGFYRNFWGYGYWSPGQVYQIFEPRPIYTGGGGGGVPYNASLGYSTPSATSSGTSGTVAAAAPTSSSSSSSSGISRDTGSAGGRSR